MTAPARAPRHFAVMPAGGTGSRLGATIPKQYLELAGEPMIRRAAAALLAAPWVDRLLVVVAAGDERAAPALAGLPRTTLLEQGGATRRDTVLAGLRVLRSSLGAADDDWVLVHDAARPGLDPASLERLRERLADDPVGGLLAMPVSDTVKRAAAGGAAGETAGEARVEAAAVGAAVGATVGATAEVAVDAIVEATIPRERLWLAQTPQMFRLGLLLGALTRFGEVTDEAAAIERAGLAPKLVPGARTNFKVTSADDLETMRRLFESAPAAQPGR